jgi:ribonuclease P protein component
MGEAFPGGGAPSSFGLPSPSRITRARDIRAVLRSGRKRKTSHLDVFFLSSGEAEPRVGLIVPKHGQCGAGRNRVKRRLREVSRREILPRLRDGGVSVDVLVRARKEAYRASYQQLRRELVGVAEELCSG